MKTHLILMITAALLLGSSGKLHAAWEFTATAIGGGSVDITTGPYNEGDTIIVTASPDPSGTNAFVKWTGNAGSVNVTQKYEPVLRLTCSGAADGAFNVTSTFGKAWYVATVAAGGSDTNDGQTLGTAFATIAKAIDAASAGEVVLVDSGNYDVSATMTVDKGITIRGLFGAEQTRVTRTAGSPTMDIKHADAVVEGLYFYKGYSRTVRIWAAGGTCRKCIVSGSTYTVGTGLGVYMQGGRLSRCVITNNAGSSSTSGAGLHISGGIAENCLIADNRSSGEGFGSGVYMAGGTVRNCTIVKNVSGSGGVYATGGTMENCIVWNNIVQASHSEVVSTSANVTFFNCHFPLQLTDNSGVFTDCILTNTAPNFRDAANVDFRLTLGSPCVDAGRIDAVATGGYDLKGNARLVGAKVDIGAYEFDPGEGLTCDVIAPLMEAVGALDVTLTAAVSGPALAATLAYAWTTNGVVAGFDPTLGLTLTNPGVYTVGLTVDDGDAHSTTVRTNLLYVVPQILYVEQDSPGAVFPYATLETAASDIQTAIDASREGCRVLVGPGDYKLDTSIQLSKHIEIRASEGPDQTRLYKTLSDVIMLQLGHSQAFFNGFNFDGGRPSVVSIWANGGVVSNCYIQNGYYTAGTGVGLRARAGLVTHCLISGNSCYRDGAGVGAFLEGDAVVENCLITNNISTAPNTTGCVYLKGNTVIRNCTIVANQASNGGGVYTDNGGTVENCIIYNNAVNGAAGDGDPDWFNSGTKAIYRNNCTPIDIGTDCVTDLPNFLGAANADYRISPASLCVDAGVTNGLIGTTDYYGNPRIFGKTVDIGCHEAIIEGAVCDILADALSILEGQAITLTALAVGFPPGAILTYSWYFDGDEVVDATGLTVAHTFPNGLSTVKLTVTDGTTTVSIVKPDLLRVAPLELYVLTENEAAAYPYDSWQTAATNIQDAIDTATDGSTVWVGDGQYRIKDRLELTKSATLSSVNGPDSVHVVQTINARVFYVAAPDAVVKGLTLRNGTGGVMMDRAGGTLVDLVITNNSYGAGGGNGAGLQIYAGTVQRCVITDNRMTGSSSIAGLSIMAQVGTEDPPVLIENCLIVGNKSTKLTTDVGGVNALSGTIRNCTIVGNVASNATSAAGIYASNKVTVENCIIMDNINTQNPDIANWDGAAASFSYTCATPELGGTRNLTDDPLFVNRVEGDYRLQTGSPCIDVGLTSEGMDEEFDLSGGRRVWHRFVDLGAYEFVPPPGSMILIR